MKNIYLCGFMGCGKSHTGRLLAKMLGCTFADLDKYIEEKEGRSIPDIFANEGEAYFRTLESRYIKEMPENSVVATGGGAIINPDTAKTAREKKYGYQPYVLISVCYGRIKGDTHRPLVVNNTKEQLEALFNKRREIYIRNSSVTVNANGKDKDIAAEIISKCKES